MPLKLTACISSLKKQQQALFNVFKTYIFTPMLFFRLKTFTFFTLSSLTADMPSAVSSNLHHVIFVLILCMCDHFGARVSCDHIMTEHKNTKHHSPTSGQQIYTVSFSAAE